MPTNVLYFKLVTGEHIISFIDTMDSEYVMLHRPLQLILQNTYEGAAVRVSKWIPFTEENYFPLDVRHIIMRANPESDIVDYYINALKKLDRTENAENDFEKNDDDEEEIALAMVEKFSNTNIRMH